MNGLVGPKEAVALSDCNREKLDSPVFTLIFIWHGAALASPAVITVTLGVQAGSVDTTVPSAVEAIICNYNTF